MTPTIRNPCFLWCSKKRGKMLKETALMSTKTSPKIRLTETCKNVAKIALNIDNVYHNVGDETCVRVLRSGAMWMPRGGHIGALLDGQCHVGINSSGSLLTFLMTGSRQNVKLPWCHLTWWHWNLASPPWHPTWIVAGRWRGLPRRPNFGWFGVLGCVHFDVPSNTCVFRQTFYVD